MSVRPRSQRAPAKKAAAEKLIQKAFADEITAKAALLVIHRVARSLNETDPVKQREAIDKLMKFADNHPLPISLEALL